MSGCPMEDLEAYSGGALGEAESARVAEHARSCPLCAEEIAYLRAERRLFEVRAAELPGPPAFADVLARAEAAGAEPRAVAELSSPARKAPLKAPRKAPREAPRKGAAGPRILRAATLFGLAAAAALAGLLVRSTEAPVPVVVSPEPPPPAAAAPLDVPSIAGEPERADEVECQRASIDPSLARPDEPQVVCGEGRGVPYRMMETCVDEEE